MPIHRRTFLGHSLAIAALATPGIKLLRAADGAAAGKPIDIGSRRELFVDDFLMERLVGQAELRLHEPQPQNVAIEHDVPWEGSGSGYHSLFQDGDRYRMYYRGSQLEVVNGKLRTDSHPTVLCYAESDDGIQWRRPDLGLHDFQGSKANNIVMVAGDPGLLGADPGHAAIFRDENPAASADARYKAILRCPKPYGLLAFKSADGLRWQPISTTPVITDGAFDSQNLAFWDSAHGEYRAYWRYFTGGSTREGEWKPTGVRAIRTARSSNFLNWTDQADLSYVDSPEEQMYTNQVKPYGRAPHILIGFPTRYIDRGWSDTMRALPDRESRENRATANQRYGTAVTEAQLMASRDGVRFKRWNEAFFRPGIERPGTWQYGQQYVAWHVVETRSTLDSALSELSFYASESYWTGNSCVLRRYTLRLDGFVSVHAKRSGGELITKPILFSGRALSLNYATSAAGSVRIEMQSADGQPIAGFGLDDCEVLFGDTLDRRVTWKSADVGTLVGKPVRLRFELKDADLYSFRFTT